MPDAIRSARAACAVVVVAPLLFSLGGCVAAPLIELAAMPKPVARMALPDTMGPLKQGSLAAQRTAASDARPIGATAARQEGASTTEVAACSDGRTGSPAPGCDVGTPASMIQGLASGLHRLSPVGLLSH